MLDVTKFEQQKEFPTYKLTTDEVIKADFIKRRFTEMKAARTLVDKDWDLYQTMIAAPYMPYPDERSSSVVPLASSLIELYVAEALKIETSYKFKGEISKFSTQAKALEYIWKYDRRRNNRKKAFVENEYITAGFGTSVIYTGFESYYKDQLDPIVGNDMQLTWKKATIKKEEIIVKNVDIRDFYCDNQALTDISEAADCIYNQWISYEKFQNFANNSMFHNVDKVSPVQYSTEYHSFVTQEEIKQGWFVKLMHYWNVEKDVYMVLANGIPVREHPMVTTINGEKALPFTIRRLGYKNYSIYGRGFCEAGLMFNSQLNNLREMLMDAIRRSNTQVLALGNGLSFDGRSFSYDNEILTFDGNLANNFQQLSGNPPNQAIFSYMESIYKDIAMFIGIDIQNILGNAQQTAFQTEVQREASQKRVNVWLANRDMAFERFANLYKDALQTYFPRKTVDGLYPQIEIEGEALTGTGNTQKFIKKKGNSTFEATPELLRGDIYIDVYTNTNATTINAVDREQKMGFMRDLPTIAQGYMLAKQAGLDIESVLPLKQTIRDLAEDYNIQIEAKGDGEDVKKAKEQMMAQLQAMMSPAPTSQPQPQAPQGQQSPLQSSQPMLGQQQPTPSM